MRMVPKTYRLIHRIVPLLSLFCLLPLTNGCGNLYTGDESLYMPNKDTDTEETKLPVTVAFSDPIYNVLTTRGVSVLDPADTENFNKRISDGTFFVYAFRRDNPNGMTYAHHRSDDAEHRYCLIDASLDEAAITGCAESGLTPEQCREHGKQAKYAGNGSFINWKYPNDIPYYNLQEEYDAFQFFAYYYDDAQIGSVKREADRICFDITVDGSQDLMCAAASNLNTLIEDVENNRNIPADYREQADRLKKLSADERQLMKSCYYGTYTARRNIWPIIRMHHQLAYVKLKFYSASNEPDDVVYITGVWIETVNKGTFTVASTNTDQVGVYFPDDGERGKLPARNTDGTEIKWTDAESGNYLYPIQTKEEDLDKEVSKRPATNAGMFLMPPGNNAKLLVRTDYYPKGNPDDLYSTTFAYDLKDVVTNKDAQGNILNKGFMGGREYDISAYIYGPQRIELNVQSASWVEGGDIEIGEEE